MELAARGFSAGTARLPISPIFFNPKPLRRGHHHRHALVLDQLVGAQMHLRLHRISAAARNRASSSWRSGTTRPFQIRVPSKSTSIVTTREGPAGAGACRSACSADRVRLDGNRDDEHDEQNQHHVDQRGWY